MFFWLHLSAGVAAAAVVLVMASTGVLLTYERQIAEWADRDVRFTGAAGAALTPEALMRTHTPDVLTLRADPRAAVEMNRGPRVFYVDPHKGHVLGEGSPSVRAYFRAVTTWHRYLALEGPLRPLGRSITGAANLVFLGLVVSGIFLWMPRKWTRKNVRAVLWFRRGVNGRAREFNWHNTIGIWTALPLIAVIVGAAVISYPWATNLVYRMAGSNPPAASSSPPQSRPPDIRAIPDLTGLDLAFDRARTSVPAWQTITWRASASKAITLAVAESHRGRVDLKTSLSIDRTSGDVLQRETFSSYSRGRQWRLWLRFIHTGEAFNAAGQTVAGLASAGASVLAFTGLLLSWRRFRSWVSRRKNETSTVASGPLPV